MTHPVSPDTEPFRPPFAAGHTGQSTPRAPQHSQAPAQHSQHTHTAGGASDAAPPPSMATRLLARVLDGLIVLAASLMVVVMMYSPSLPTIWTVIMSLELRGSLPAGTWRSVTYVAMALVVLLVAATYEIVTTTCFGATVGKWVCKLEVVRIIDHRRPTAREAALRWAVSVLGVLALVVGALVVWLSPLWDRTGHRRGWHDRAAHVVVRART